MVNPLLPRLLISLAIAGVAAFSAWRSAQDMSARAGGGSRFRPRHGKSARRNPGNDAPVMVDRQAIARTRDALSGATLDPDAEIFRCADCQSFYTAASVRALAQENGARCINCGSTDRVAVQVVARQ
jgi:DNA-directed RNA polymerase subunit RPC12/RpoP